jgi:Arc/MetJ-type ribon-helix-helix transcriptional regulator
MAADKEKRVVHSKRLQVRLPEPLLTEAEARAGKHGYSTMSDYVRMVLADHFKREDLERRIDTALKDQMRRIRGIHSGTRLVYGLLSRLLATTGNQRLIEEAIAEVQGELGERFDSVTTASAEGLPATRN